MVFRLVDHTTYIQGYEFIRKKSHVQSQQPKKSDQKWQEKRAIHLPPNPTGCYDTLAPPLHPSTGQLGLSTKKVTI